LIGLAIVIVSTVVANALVTGTLSMVEDRLQSRVVWLIPLLAIILVLDWFEQLATRQPARTS
jgi:fucose permease